MFGIERFGRDNHPTPWPLSRATNDHVPPHIDCVPVRWYTTTFFTDGHDFNASSTAGNNFTSVPRGDKNHLA